MKFEKVHTCGNDFLLLEAIPTCDQIAALCQRKHGIGADGIMVFHGLAASGMPQFSHFDPDGSRSLCLNGLRASLQCLSQREPAFPTAGSLHYEGQSMAFRIAESAELTLSVGSVKPQTLELEDGTWSGFFVDTGNPHFLLHDHELSVDAFRALARKLRRHPVFPNGANIHALWPQANAWRIRSFERGVEDITLACGSGILAAAIMLHREHALEAMRFLPDGGDFMQLCVLSDKIVLSGPTHWVASGEWRC